MKYDVAIIGAGPGGIFTAYELVKLGFSGKIAVFETGAPLEERKCPIDGKKIKTFGDLQETLAKHRPGDKVTLKVLRNKKEQNIEMVLKNEQGTTKVVKDNGMEILGAAFRELPDETRKALRISTGVEVTGVTDGKMKEAGVRKGFIIIKANGQTVKSVEHLEEIVKEASRSTDQVLFLSGVFPSGKRANYAVDLTQE